MGDKQKRYKANKSIKHKSPNVARSFQQVFCFALRERMTTSLFIRAPIQIPQDLLRHLQVAKTFFYCPAPTCFPLPRTTVGNYGKFDTKKPACLRRMTLQGCLAPRIFTLLHLMQCPSLNEEKKKSTRQHCTVLFSCYTEHPICQHTSTGLP